MARLERMGPNRRGRRGRRPPESRRLRKRLRRAGVREGYAKNDPRMYERLLPLQPDAIQHALRLVREHDEAGHTTPASRNPCTMVHRLVEALNAEIP